jgi:MFS family permease
MAMAGFLFLITLYLQDVRGYRPLIAGLFLLPMALMMAACAPLAGRMVANRGGPRLPLAIAGVAIMAGGALLVGLTASSPAWYLVVSAMVLGVGMGWVNAPITNSAVSGMPRSRAGVASAIASTSRQVGTSLGVAIMGSVLAANLHGPITTGFTSATRPGWWITVGCGLVVFVLALWTTGRAGSASARRAAELIVADEAEPKVPAGA